MKLSHFFTYKTTRCNVFTVPLIILLCFIVYSPYAMAQRGEIKLDGESFSYHFSGPSFIEDKPLSKLEWGVLKYYYTTVKANEHVWINCNNTNKPTKIAAKEIRIEIEFFGDAVNGKILQVAKPIQKVYKNETRVAYAFDIPSNCESGSIHLYYRTKKGKYIYVHNEFSVNGSTTPTVKKAPSTNCDECGEPKLDLWFKGLTGTVYKVCSKAYKGRGSNKVKTSDYIFENDLITCYNNSHAVIQNTYTKSTYTLGSNTSCLITNGRINVVRGTLLVNYEKATQKMEVVLKKLKTHIKGTIVAFEETETESRVWLFAGSVEVSNLKGGKTVTLVQGQSAVVGSNNTIKVNTFNIDQVAKRFGVSESEINRHGGSTSSSGTNSTIKKPNKTVDNRQQSDVLSSSSSGNAGKYARYGAKRGIVKSVDGDDDIRMHIITWWDDYGRLERSEITGCEEKKGGKWVSSSYSQIINIIVDDKHYMYNKSIGWKQMKNTATSFLGSGTKTVNGCKLTKSGTATVAGKQCDVFKGKKGSTTIEYYIWEGVVLKRVEKSSEGTTTTTAKSIELPNSIDSSKFAIPKTGIKK